MLQITEEGRGWQGHGFQRMKSAQEGDVTRFRVDRGSTILADNHIPTVIQWVIEGIRAEPKSLGERR
jgi:hypothetical protein